MAERVQRGSKEMPVPYMGLLSADRYPLSDITFQTVLVLQGAPPDALKAKRQKIIADKNPPWGVEAALSILEHRLHEDVKVEDHAWWFTGTLCHNPGHSVLWAYTLSVIGWVYQQEVTYDLLVTDDRLFALGIPDLNKCVDLWDDQKRSEYNFPEETDNWLDDPGFWEANRKHFLSAGTGALKLPNTVNHV